MTRAISVRLDEESLRALASLESSGLSRSQAIRTAVVEAAARQKQSVALAREAAALEANEYDRRVIRRVAALMEGFRVPR